MKICMDWMAFSLSRSLFISLFIPILVTACATPEERRFRAVAESISVKTLETVPLGELEASLAGFREFNDARAAYLARKRCEELGAEYKRNRCLKNSMHYRDKKNISASQVEVGEVAELEYVQVTGSRISPTDIITNNQEQGVDEGDIVKKIGDYLIVLREGELFSVFIGSGADQGLSFVDRISVAGLGNVDEKTGEPNIWFDEALAFEGGVIVVGYNFKSKATELFVMAILSDGKFERGERISIASDDYYNGVNYGSRVRGDELVMSLASRVGERVTMPSWSRHGESESYPLLGDRDIHLPLVIPRFPRIHSVLRCSLEKLLQGSLDCNGASVVGGRESTFYVSGDAAYLASPGWEVDAYFQDEAPNYSYFHPVSSNTLWPYRYTALYRVPFEEDESIRVARFAGEPGTQFGFKEVDGTLHVLMNTHEDEGLQTFSLQKLDIDDFGESLETRSMEVATIVAGEAHYTSRLTSNAAWLGEHRWVLEEAERPNAPTRLLVQPLDGSQLHEVTVDHSVDRIEDLGDAVFVSGSGNDEQWSMTLVEADQPFQSGTSLVVPGYYSAESMSHAFNQGTLPDGERLLGMPGFPIGPAESDGFDFHRHEVSDLIYFSRNDLELTYAGILSMQDKANLPEECEDEPFGCSDWYGNARLFFIGERIFGLSANVITESRYRHGRVEPLRTIMFDD